MCTRGNDVGNGIISCLVPKNALTPVVRKPDHPLAGGFSWTVHLAGRVTLPFTVFVCCANQG